MGLFGFGKKKEYKRGMADAAEVASQKFDEVDKAIGNVSDNLKTGIDNLQGDVNSIHDMLESDAREKLFDLVDELDIREDLNEDTKWFMISMLYSLGQMVQTSEAQKHYLRALTAYLKIEKSPQTIDVTKVINIDDREESRAIYTAVIEYLYLRSEELSFLSDNQYEDLFDSFNLNKRDKVAVVDRLNAKVATMGSDAIVLPYEAALVEKEENDKVESEKKASQSWPDREQRLGFFLDKFEEFWNEYSFGINGWEMEGWNYQRFDYNGETVNVTNGTELDDVVMQASYMGSFGMAITLSELVLYVEGGVVTKIPFDNVAYIYKAQNNEHTITLKMIDGTLETYMYPDFKASNGLAVDVLFGILHANVKNGPVFLADENYELKGMFDSALKDEVSLHQFDLVGFLKSQTIWSHGGAGFENSTEGDSTWIGKYSIANKGKVVIWESRGGTDIRTAGVYLLKEQEPSEFYPYKIDERKILWDDIQSFSYTESYGGIFSSDNFHVNAVLSTGDVEVIINDVLHDFDDQKLMGVMNYVKNSELLSMENMYDSED